ncbi:E3 ubiquitin-protein ligase TRIM71-like [Haliotis rufescens]|uniref:E3 ubiquitin-protein ligase TRIM71-like n=1 Tax=Haliotis rufescens TaxID=6454 RepID=UPI00201F09A0|nr:E3 ubiquitin-protein ligase TRIM71-like [Haliotis rufescens]
MSGGPSTKVDIGDLKDAFLECAVCTEHFNLDERKPRLLRSCLHAFCSHCLQKLLEKQGKGIVTCPLCRHVENGVNKIDILPIDPVRSNLVEYLQVKQQKKVLCSDCPESLDAISRCQDCKSYLCKDCDFAHHRNKLSRDHSIISLEKLLEEPVKTFSRGNFCPSHPKYNVEFFCSTCKTLCCLSCTVVDHSGHTFMKPKEAAQAGRQDIERSLAEVGKMTGRLQTLRNKGKQQEKLLTMATKNGMAEIDKMFDCMNQLLKERKDHLKVNIQDKNEQMVTSVQKATETYEQTLAIIESSTSYYNEAQKRVDDVEMLQMYPAIKQTLQSMVDEDCTSNVPLDDDTFGFRPELDCDLGLYVSKLGQIRNTIAIPFPDVKAKVTSSPRNFERSERKEQKTVINELRETPLIVGEVRYIVAAEWFEKWERYVGIFSDDGSPGPIDNTPLLTYHKTLRKSRLYSYQQQKDMVTLPKAAFGKLLEWYGIVAEDTVLYRSVIKVEARPEIEIHPLELCLKCVPSGQQLTKSLSRETTIGELEMWMRKTFGVPKDAHTHLLTGERRGKFYYEQTRLEPQKNLYNAGLKDQQTVELHVQSVHQPAITKVQAASDSAKKKTKKNSNPW